MLGTSKSVLEFDVKTIPGCALWIDASRETQTVGSYITTLLDHSGKGNDLVPVEQNVMTLLKDSILNRNVYHFGYSRAYHPNFNWQTSFTQFVVVRCAGYGGWFVTNGSGTVGYMNYVLSGNWDLLYVGQTFGVVDGNNDVLHISIFNDTPQGKTGWQLFCIGYTAGSQNVTNFTLNGIPRSATTGNPCTVLQQSYPLWINGRWDYANDDAYVAEFIHFNTSLTTEQRQQVEGHLSWKWGLNQTPSVPKVLASIPSKATGCVLWLDGADKSTMLSAVEPFSYFKFDTSLLDESNAITLTRTGSVPYVTGKYGQAISFSNASGQYSSNYLSTPFNLPSTFTVAFWFQTPSASPNAQIFCTAPNSGYSYGGICAYLASGNLYHAYSHIQNGGAVGAINPNTWYHVALTYSNGTCLAYLNGSLGGNPVTASGSSINGFTLGGGGDYGFDPYPFTGYVDDLQIFTSVLTASQIANIYSNNLSNSVTSWLDKSGNNNTAVNVNSSARFTDEGVYLNGSGYFTIDGLKNSLVDTPFVLFIVETLGSTTNQPALFGDNVTTGGTNGGLHLIYINESFFLDGFYGNDLYFYNISGTGAKRLWTFYLPKSSNRTLRLNGSLVGTHNNFNRLNAFQQPVLGRVFGSHNYTGTFSEVLLYVTDVGLSTVQQIENYLLNKWNIVNTSLTVKRVPVSSPLTVQGCKLWLDGADSNSLSLSGSNVLSWSDKSGNRNTASLGTNSSSIVSTSKGLVFDGSGFMHIPGLSNILVNSPFAIFIVETAKSTNSSYFFADDTEPGPAEGTLLLGYRNSTDAVFGFWYDDLEDYAVVGTGSVRVWCFYLPYSSNRTIRRNGILVSTHSNYNRLSRFLTPTIGRLGSDTFYTGTISEIIVYNCDPGLVAIQRIESYLINKWKLTSDPSVPKSLAGMSLWLDGADVTGNGTPTADGSAISTWYDKSGNNANATVCDGSPTYNALTQSLYFNGSSSFVLPNGTISSGSSTFTIFIVCKAESFSSYPYVYFAGYAGYDTAMALIFYPDGTVENGFYTDFMGTAPAGTVSLNTTYLFTSAYDGTSRVLYMNGTPIITGSRGGTKNIASAYNLIGGHGGYIPFYTGTISEMIVFNRTLTDSERQSVDSYLTAKWSVPQANLSKGPVSSAPGCWMWLDGSDPLANGKAPSSGTAITVWADKSGNGRNAVANSSSPVYLLNSFNGLGSTVFSSDSMSVPSSELSPNNTLTVFVVFSTNGNSADFNNDFFYFSSPTVTYQTFDMFIDESNALNICFNGYSTTLSLGPIVGTPLLVSVVSDSTTITYYINGTQVTSYSLGTISYSLHTTIAPQLGQNSFSGSLCEIMVYNTAMSQSQQQAIESYLALKWGLFLPFTPVLTSPLIIPGCKVWLDGADPDATGIIPKQGAKVAQWVDKSGFQNSPTATAGSFPTYSANLKCVQWDAAQANNTQLIFPTSVSSVVSQRPFTIFIVEKRTKGGAEDNFILRGTTLGVNYNLLIGHTNPSFYIRFAFYGNDLDCEDENFYTGEPPMIGCYQYSKPNRAIYRNGFLRSSDGNSSDLISWDGAMIGGASIWPAYGGNVHELIMYDCSLSLEQRQSVERYLLKKWSVPITLYKDVPGQIPGCQLWLDASDTSTVFSDVGGTIIVTHGSEVKCWKDKSGRSRNYTPYYLSPTYDGGDGGSVQFSSGSLQNNDSWNGNGGGVDIFVVSTPWTFSQTNDWRTLFRGDNGHRVIIGYTGNELGFYGNQGTYFSQYGSLTLGNVKSLLYVTTNSSFQSSAGLNGSPLSVAGGTQDYNAYPFKFLGGYLSYQNWGKINEVMIFPNMSTAQRKTIETYLANKWNLTSELQVLPSSHPFKQLKPFSRTISPVDVPNLQLWLDAYDSSTLVNNSSTVVGLGSQEITRWNDKSGNERHMEVQDGTISYADRGVVSTGSGYLRVLSPVDISVFTLFFVVTVNPNYENQTVFQAISGSGAVPYYEMDAFDFFIDYGSYARLYAGGSALGLLSANNQPQTSGPKVFSYSTDGNNLSTWINGQKLSGVNVIFRSTRTRTSQGFVLGAEPFYNAKTSRSPVHEVIVYNSVVIEKQRKEIEGYLAKKWKISLQNPTVFTYTGDLQTWICPAGMTRVTVHAWGAGGGCAQQGGIVGGAGAYVTGTLTVTPGTTYFIVVGGGGYKVDSEKYYVSPLIYGGGGRGYYGGGGGGYSGIFSSTPSQSTALLIVGGGGGAGPDGGSDVGGSASYTSTAYSGGTNSGTPGSGASSSGPGAGGGGSGGGGGTYGGALYGGDGAHYAGGGGAGYWGGGGGGSYVTGGGGGNSYWNSSFFTLVSGEDSTSAANVTNLSGPGSSSPYYQMYVASSSNYQNGGNGLIVFAEAPGNHPYQNIPPLVNLPFMPTNLKGCVLWLDASTVKSLSGVFPNLAIGSQYSVTCSGTVIEKGKNRLNIVRVARTQFLQVRPDPILNAYTLFWVGRENGQVARGLNGYYNQLYGYWGYWKKSLYISGNPSYLTGYYADANWDMFSHSRRSSGPYTMKWNGEALFSGSISTSNPLYGLTINAGDFNDTSGNGNYENSDSEVAEILLFDNVLTFAEIQQIEGYLSQKWAISIPTSHPYATIPPAKKNQITYDNYLLTTVFAPTWTIPDRSGPSIASGNGFGWGSIIQSATTYRYIALGNNNGVYINGYGNYSALTTGYVYAEFEGTILFYVVTDDGIIVKFNGLIVIDQYQPQGATGYYSATLTLKQGYTPITILWYDSGGGGMYNVYYSLNGNSLTSDTLGVFYHDSTATY